MQPGVRCALCPSQCLRHAVEPQPWVAAHGLLMLAGQLLHKAHKVYRHIDDWQVLYHAHAHKV